MVSALAMSNRNHFVDHCSELLAPLGQVRVRRMFGGHGVYLDDLFVAILADQVLYLKVDASSEPAFREAGCHAFEYTGKGKVMRLSFWTVPEEAMEAAPAMMPWARLALDAALRARHAPAQAKNRPSRRSTRPNATRSSG